jgi:hypothetical protein
LCDGRDRFLDVPCARAEIGSALRLKPKVQLPHIVKSGKHAQAYAIGCAQVATGEPGESPLPYPEAEDRLRHGRDVCTMVN